MASKQAIIVSPVKSKEAEKLYAKSYPSHMSCDLEEEEHGHNLIETQNSVYFQPLCTHNADNWMSEDEDEGDEEEEDEGEASDGSDSWMYPCQVDLVQLEEMRRKEIEESNKRISSNMKRKADEQLYEDETEPEDIFIEQQVKKRVRRKGPTTGSHCEDELPGKEDWAPSDPEDDEQLGFLGEEEDDGCEPLPFVLEMGEKA